MGLTKEKLRRRRKRQRQERILRIIILIALILIVIYIVGAVFSAKHFCGKNTVFGVKISGQTVEELKEQLKEKVSGYQIEIVTRTGNEIITADEIDLQFLDNGMIEELKDSQKTLLWFTGIFGESEDIPIEMDYDQDLMEEKIQALDCMLEENMESPVNAHLEYSDGAFQIIKETYGTQLQVEKAKTMISEAILNGETSIDLESVQCYVMPEIYEESKALIELCKNVNKLIDVTITYDFSDRQEIVDNDKIAEWIVFGDDFTYELDYELIYRYMKELGRTYDTFGLPHTFVTSSGATITLEKGDYGWCIYKSESAKALIALIEEGKSVTTEPVYLYSGICRDTNDIGNTYIEISIAEQRMWCYVDGVCIVDTPIVSGTKGVKDRATPSNGVWAIDAKMTDYVLVGEDYESPVKYWLPFNVNVGIHDASWRDEFGGDIYVKNGSHGCINTPDEAVQKIYENVIIGTPVVVY